MDEQGQNNNLGNNQDQPPQTVPVQPDNTNNLGPAQGWQYQSGNLAPQGNFTDNATPAGQSDDQPQPRGPHITHDSISWSASEFVQNEKSATWYIYLALGTVFLGAVIYFLTKEIFSVVVIGIAAIAFGVFAALKPRVLKYTVNPSGIQIGNRHFHFDDFRSFAIIEEGALPSIQLLPHKRLAVAVSMFFEPKDGDKIVEILGTYLPFEHRDRDLMDKLASKIHF